ncbi:MAG: hypothetical protein Tsb0015_16560 [Simkaniaceae bacterium]
MSEKELEKKLAKIESLYDQLLADVDNLNQLLIELGFEEGIITLREAAKELLEKKKKDFSSE